MPAQNATVYKRIDYYLRLYCGYIYGYVYCTSSKFLIYIVYVKRLIFLTKKIIAYEL